MLKKLKMNIITDYVKDFNLYIEKQKEIADLKSKITQWEEKAKKIQSRFEFIIPSYIIDEIIEKGTSIYQDHENLYYLINCAVLNNRITNKDAKRLKEIY